MGDSKGIIQSVMSIPEFASDVGIGYRPSNNSGGGAPAASPSPFQQAVAALLAPSPQTPAVMAPSATAAPAASNAASSSISTPATDDAAITVAAPSAGSSATAAPMANSSMITPPEDAASTPAPSSSSGAAAPTSGGNTASEGTVPYPIPITKANGTKKIPVISKSDKQEASRTQDAEQIRFGRPDWMDELMANPNLDHSQFLQKFIYSGMLLPQTA